MTSGETTVHRATAELIALAIAVRPDWPEHQVSGAIAAAVSDGMTWEQVLLALPRLMVDPASHPREMVREYQHARPSSVPAEHNPEYAAARAELERQRATRSAEGSDAA